MHATSRDQAPDDRISRAFALQVAACDRLGSPFTAKLLAALQPLLDDGTQTGRKVLGWPGQPDANGDSVPLRLAGALHHLVRTGAAPTLARLYPPNEPPDPDALSSALRAVLAEQDTVLAGWLAFAPQTNEVARASLLHAGLGQIARRTGCALALHEIGASAGLNLMLDRFAFRLGGRCFGDAASGVRLEPGWSGPPPSGDEPRIVSRRGCDLAPLDVGLAEHRQRLIAYVWADQAQRLARLEAAIAIARRDPPLLERADAADWIERVILPDGQDGIARVVMHSIAFQYFPAPAQERIRRHLAAVGAAAAQRSPLAWLAFEQRAGGRPALTLRLWPDGAESVLAEADAHVREVRWLAG